MANKSNKQSRNKFDLALICCMSSSLLITSYALPIRALANSLHSKPFLIAKPPDERQPAAVEKGIEQIPVAQPPVSRQPKQPIESPLPVNVSSEPVNSTPTSQPSETSATQKPTGSNPAPKPSNTGTTSTPTTTGVSTTAPKPSNTGTTSTPTTTGVSTTAPKPSNTGMTSTPTATGVSTTAPKPSNTGTTSTPTTTGVSTTAPKPSNTGTTSTPTATGVSIPVPAPSRRATPARQGRPKPTTAVSSSVSSFKAPNFREINFVDIAFGVLAPGDYQSQGRYYQFYQFEGRENQLIQIRLSGSVDRRRSNNLSLDPFMFLLDPNNQVLVSRGSGEANPQGVKDAFIFVRLPVKGTYTIAVTSRNPGDKGRYSLALRDDRASYTLDASNELTRESPIQRKSGSPYNISKFQGKKDQLVSIRVDSIFEEFSPYIVLMNSQGQIIAADNDKDGRYSALIDRAKLPGDDTYYVVVISANGRERGRYRLTVF